MKWGDIGIELSVLAKISCNRALATLWQLLVILTVIYCFACYSDSNLLFCLTGPNKRGILIIFVLFLPLKHIL